MYYLYIIKSDVFDRIYIGTTAHIDTRVTQHKIKIFCNTAPSSNG
ncbi:TPA: hypothetical protein DEB00_00515 [Candidatus Uhrbacteria bacterium]|nr:hypothetical protein [Candidatus Uhrbacteria bacterium]